MTASVSRTYMLIPPFTTRPHNAPRIQILGESPVAL